jgi:hypothetical protein
MRCVIVLIILSQLLACPTVHAETYVTERNVSIDRCGTAWFITRFVDAEAEFQFFETGKTPPPGITYAFFGSRYFNKGPDCTFAVMVKSHKKGGLKPLQQMNEQFNDIFAWRAGPDSMARHLREGIAEIRKDNNSDLETYHRLFVAFDFLYLAYGGDKAQMLPSRRRDMDHLPLRMLLEFADDPDLRSLPAYPAIGASLAPGAKDFEKKIQAIYEQLPLGSPSMAPLDRNWVSQCNEHGWHPDTYGPLLRWIELRTPTTPDRQALRKMYLLINQRLMTAAHE